MVGRGEFSINAERGPAVGSYQIEVRNLGSIETNPTLDDVRRIDGGDFSCEIKSGTNRIVVEIE
jgi:hypothetical protein